MTVTSGATGLATWVSWAGLLLCFNSTPVSAQESAHLTEADAKLIVDGSRVYSTQCGPQLSTVAASRRLATATAARAIVQWRDGVIVQGSEFAKGSEYTIAIREDTLGTVGALELVAEDSHGGFAHDKWCVTVREKSTDEKISNKQ